MGKYEIEIPDKLLIDAGGLLNEILHKLDISPLGNVDKWTTSTGETIPVLQKDMTLNDLMVLCIEQSVVRFNKILKTVAPKTKDGK